MTGITSEPYRLSSAEYQRRLAFDWVTRWWWAFALPLIAIAAWAFYDIRAVYVTLIVIFLIYPMAMSFVWFAYAMSPDSLRAISLQRATISDDGIRFEYLPADENAQVFDGQFFAWDDISVAEDSKAFTLLTGPKPDCRRRVPLDALSPEAIAIFRRHIDVPIDDF